MLFAEHPTVDFSFAALTKNQPWSRIKTTVSTVEECTRRASTVERLLYQAMVDKRRRRVATVAADAMWFKHEFPKLTNVADGIATMAVDYFKITYNKDA